jgi:GWxTD domain-containing protein
MIRAGQLLLLTASFLAACGTTQEVQRTATSTPVYGRGTSGPRVDVRAYHLDTARSVLYFKLRTQDLLYRSAGGGAPFRSRVRITYERRSAMDAKVLLDSASVVVSDTSTDPLQDKELIGHMELPRLWGSEHPLRVTVFDMNRETTSSVTVVWNGKPGSAADFLPVTSTGLPLFDDHFSRPDTVRVQCACCLARPVQCRVRGISKALPAPVFSLQTANPIDTTVLHSFTVIPNERGAYVLNTSGPGWYHLGDSAAHGQGYSFFAFDAGYPLVRAEEDLLSPLRYILSNQEYERMSEGDPRKAVERFWIDAAGGKDRAREAIRAYYGRVEMANRWFTSFSEGWRSDRGLVHIIFGTPTTIHRGEHSETWTYGEESNLLGLSFTFLQRTSPSSPPDMVLQREPIMKAAWYRNVESWRNGRVQTN